MIKKSKQKAVETGYNSLYSNCRALSCRKCSLRAKPIDHHCRDTVSRGLDRQATQASATSNTEVAQAEAGSVLPATLNAQVIDAQKPEFIVQCG